jgi:hypothetical protein
MKKSKAKPDKSGLRCTNNLIGIPAQTGTARR